MAQTTELPPAEAPLQPPPDGEAPPAPVAEEGEAPAAVEEEPQVIRVRSSGPPNPILLAAVAVPALLLSFLGAWFVARSSAAPAPVVHEEWAYEGEHGPATWGSSDPHNAACQLGDEQSPIDIHPSRLHQIDWLTPISYRYKPDKDIELVRDGHGFKVNYDHGSRITLLGQEFELLQFHVHGPSEHTLNGKAYDMELHLVHATPDAAQRLAVLGVRVSEGPENPVFSRFWGQIPEKEAIVKTKIEVNAQDLLPKNRSYFFYEGSLTTPPCTQGVRWVMFREPITASKAQIQRVKDLFHGNARPVQPIKDRFIKEELPP